MKQCKNITQYNTTNLTVTHIISWYSSQVSSHILLVSVVSFIVMIIAMIMLYVHHVLISRHIFLQYVRKYESGNCNTLVCVCVCVCMCVCVCVRACVSECECVVYMFVHYACCVFVHV